MRMATRWCWCIALGLLTSSGAALRAEPINYLAGSIYHFRLTSSGITPGMPGPDPSTPMLDGRIYVNLQLGPADASYRNGVTIPAAATTFQPMNFAFDPVPVPFPGGYTGQVLYPQNFSSGLTIAFATGDATFSAFITMGSVIVDIGLPGEPGNSAQSLNPFPATPPGPNGLTLLGAIAAIGNLSAEDLSLFGLGSDALFALTLLVDDPEFNFAYFLNNGGVIEGIGAFQMIGGIPGTNVPEPMAGLVFATTAALGLWLARRRRKAG